MDHNLDSKTEAFYQTIKEPQELDDAQLIELFGYFLHKEMGALSFSPKDIDHCFDVCGIPAPSWTRVYLNNNSKGRKAKFLKPKNGIYKLARATSLEAESLLGDAISKAQTSKTLTDLSNKFTDPIEKAFLEEAVLCFNAGANRAAIVMTWVLAVDHMYRYVLTHKLSDFHGALSKQADKKINSITIKTRDDFSELKESKFIELLKSGGIITNGVRKILDEKLGGRNDAGHPSTIIFSQKKTEVFIEDLINNVILKYPI